MWSTWWHILLHEFASKNSRHMNPFFLFISKLSILIWAMITTYPRFWFLFMKNNGKLVEFLDMSPIIFFFILMMVFFLQVFACFILGFFIRWLWWHILQLQNASSASENSWLRKLIKDWAFSVWHLFRILLLCCMFSEFLYWLRLPMMLLRFVVVVGSNSLFCRENLLGAVTPYPRSVTRPSWSFLFDRQHRIYS